MGVQIPQREGTIFGGCHSKALAIFGADVAATFAAKKIVQSPKTSCNRRYDRQTQKGLRKISGAGIVAFWPNEHPAT